MLATVPTSSPQFCCFNDESKNCSAPPSNIEYIDAYINKTNTYPVDTIFFVCSDQTGCLLYLHQMFPNRMMLSYARVYDGIG